MGTFIATEESYYLGKKTKWKRLFEYTNGEGEVCQAVQGVQHFTHLKEGKGVQKVNYLSVPFVPFPAKWSCNDYKLQRTFALTHHFYVSNI